MPLLIVGRAGARARLPAGATALQVDATRAAAAATVSMRRVLVRASHRLRRLPRRHALRALEEATGRMRERNVPHRHLCLMAKSITELEMYSKWPGLSTPGDLAVCQAEGLADADGNITPKGQKLLASFEEKDKGKKT